MYKHQELSSLFLLDPTITYLNHGSFGATPRPVFEVYQSIQRLLENEPVDFLSRKAPNLLQNARQQLASFLGVNRDDLVFVPNATHGINIVAQSLALQPGDEVLTTDHEYGAMDRIWQFLSDKTGFSYKPLQIDLPLSEPSSFITHLFSQVTNRTKVIYLSHITSPTALIFPVKEICDKAREMGILTVIDGAHAPGQISLDVKSVGADFYTGNCHKWLCAPKGSAFLFAHREMQNLIEPLIVSWGWRAENPGVSRFIDYLERTGTIDISSYLSVPAAIDFQTSHGWQAVRQECHDLTVWINQELCDLFACAPLSSSSSALGQMVSIPLPRVFPSIELQRRLFIDFKIEVPIVPWKDKMLIRVSVQGYNNLGDLEKLIAALKTIYHI